MSVNYRQLEIAIGNLQAYKHGSSYGKRFTDEGGTLYYDVYSYSTLIFRWNIHSGAVAYFNNQKYSTTTSRLQNIIRRVHPEVDRLTVELLGDKPVSRDDGPDMLKTVASVMALGDLFGETQKESNDWKARMLKAGLDGRGLIMPDDWDSLDEDTKTARLNGAIEILGDK